MVIRSDEPMCITHSRQLASYIYTKEYCWVNIGIAVLENNGCNQYYLLLKQDRRFKNVDVMYLGVQSFRRI